MSEPGIRMAGLPAPLRSINTGHDVEILDRALSFRAGPATDWFIDPGGGPDMDNAPALVMPAEGPWMLSARVSAEHEATFDAAVLVVRADERTWAKLCLELSPQGEVMVVSVVTRGASDDCNSRPISGNEACLRMARMGRAFAFHYSLDSQHWSMVRYFTLGEVDTVEIGFLAQSPTGLGCTAAFEDILFIPERLADVRSGI